MKQIKVEKNLYHVGNVLPSMKLKQKGIVYGFENLDDAKYWKKLQKKEHVFQFKTSCYIKDEKTYSGRKGEEYICNEVITEKEVKE